jgi:hypothetical protein
MISSTLLFDRDTTLGSLTLEPRRGGAIEVQILAHSDDRDAMVR